MHCSAEPPVAQEPEQIALLVRTDVARAARLLVVCDFDGTMSPLVDDPAEATIDAAARASLHALSQTPGTAVAVVSGRGLDDLRTRLGEHSAVTLIGSHGGETLSGTPALSPQQRETLDAIEHTLMSIAMDLPGAAVERKPLGVAFHFRRADQTAADALIPRVVHVCERYTDIHLRRGKCVIEFAVDRVTKGDALAALRATHLPECVVFLGDDTTDEDAFAELTDADIGVKVGPGPTLASYRVSDVSQASVFLACLSAIRGNQGAPHE